MSLFQLPEGGPLMVRLLGGSEVFVAVGGADVEID